VDLIDVVDLKKSASRGEGDGFPEFPDLFDAVVRSTIDFQNIKGAAFGDFDTGFVIWIKIDFWTIGAVECLGQDPGGGGLAGSAWSY